jgi:hypothetical protein
MLEAFAPILGFMALITVTAVSVIGVRFATSRGVTRRAGVVTSNSCGDRFVLSMTASPLEILS